jgi:predicted amidohydrolase
MSALTVTVVQADLHWHNIPANLEMFSTIIDGLESGSDLIVLPEMFTTGFTMDAETYAESMDGPSVTWLASTAARRNATVCGSIIVHHDDRFLNRFIFMNPDGNYVTYDKRHLFRLAGEHEHYSAGDELITFKLNDWRVRPMICYDLRFPVWSRNTDSYDLLLYVANWPNRRHLAWETLLRGRAVENISYVVGVNRTGTDGNSLPYSGGSAIIDYTGATLIDLEDRRDTATVTLQLEPLRKFREKFPFHVDADKFNLASG